MIMGLETSMFEGWQRMERVKVGGYMCAML